MNQVATGSQVVYTSTMEIVQVALDTKLLTGSGSDARQRGRPPGDCDRCAVNLHNAVTVAQARLGRRVANLSAENGCTRFAPPCALRSAVGEKAEIKAPLAQIQTPSPN
jgi:hypothetical protein